MRKYVKKSLPTQPERFGGIAVITDDFGGADAPESISTDNLIGSKQ
jgi:hypothetical protein